jgi:hypothetical protein
MRSMPLEELPLAFNDAIIAARRMGFRHLWIDSICILQGSDVEAQADWMFESSRMRLL